MLMDSGCSNYGQYYWCVKVPKTLSENGEIYVHADKVSLSATGALLFENSKDWTFNLVLAPGQWLACYAASVFDGSAVAVEHWKGEVDRGEWER